MNYIYFIEQLNYTNKAIFLNCQDLSDDESLIWPSPGGNCVNWTVGHILFSRNDMLSLLQVETVPAKELHCYRRGVDAKQDKADFKPIQTLLKGVDVTQKRIIKKLEQPAALSDRQVREFAGLIFHEAYHAGQLGLLRRFLGKEGLIK